MRPPALLALSLVLQLALPLVIAGAAPLHAQARPPQSAPQPAPQPPALIPAPQSITTLQQGPFVIDTGTRILVSANSPAVADTLALMLRDMLSPAAKAPQRLTAGQTTPARSIVLAITPDAQVPDEGYTLNSSATSVTLNASTAAGLFYAIQTLRQLLPVDVEYRAMIPRRLTVPAVRIEDSPRFTWRGSMLDVSRHFIPMSAIKEHVDLMALYKLNRLHLHLADDQGWRIEIKSRPELTAIGSRNEVGGGPGGFYTQAEYSELVAYAAARNVMIIPEIDMPGHTNAALASIPVLNCDGVARPPYSGTRVGFSAVCVESDSTYAVIDDIFRELAAITPGPYLHMGGDEVEKLTRKQYINFVERVERIVQSHGKRLVGWGEIAPAMLDSTSVVQHWKNDSAQIHARRGGSVILSNSSNLYLDMKYENGTMLGLRWAGLVPIRKTYDWDPGTALKAQGVSESSILGVEAPLWSETLTKPADFQFMAFPRLLSVAELGWTSQAKRSWSNFSVRLAAHGPRLSALGVNFYRSPEINWQGVRPVSF